MAKPTSWEVQVQHALDTCFATEIGAIYHLQTSQATHRYRCDRGIKHMGINIVYKYTHLSNASLWDPAWRVVKAYGGHNVASKMATNTPSYMWLSQQVASCMCMCMCGTWEKRSSPCAWKNAKFQGCKPYNVECTYQHSTIGKTLG